MHFGPLSLGNFDPRYYSNSQMLFSCRLALLLASCYVFDCGHPHFRSFDSDVIIDEEAIHIKLYPNNINRDSRIEISEVWMATVKKYNSQSVTKWTYEGITSGNRNNNED